MALTAQHDTKSANVWAIPADILQAGIAALLLITYRRLTGIASSLPPATAEARTAGLP
ncbi:MAG TPA: hypothetical protein VMA72_29000 [Streptosporangiaceae bacterium]|nr:hypothetical protein [Streptosporangiaceae bacterium]